MNHQVGHGLEYKQILYQISGSLIISWLALKKLIKRVRFSDGTRQKRDRPFLFCKLIQHPIPPVTDTVIQIGPVELSLLVFIKMLTIYAYYY